MICFPQTMGFSILLFKYYNQKHKKWWKTWIKRYRNWINKIEVNNERLENSGNKYRYTDSQQSIVLNKLHKNKNNCKAVY